MAARRPGMLALLTLLTGCTAYLEHIPPVTSPAPGVERTRRAAMPADAACEFLRYRIATYQGAHDRAVEHLRAATALDPGSAPLRTRLGEQYWWRDRPEEAIAQWERALRDDPEYCPAHHMLGKLASYRLQTGMAETHLRAAIDCDPTLDGAWIDLANLYDDQRRHDEELRLLDRYADAPRGHARDDAWIQRRTGQALWELGRTEEALQALREAVILDPEDRATIETVLASYQDSNRFDEAADFLEELVHRYPSALELRQDLARVYAALGRYDDVIAQLRSEYDQDPDHRDLHAWGLATWLGRLLRHDEAAELLRTAIAEFPADSTLRLKLGWTLEESGDPDGAVEAWRQIVPPDPHWSLAVRESARVLEEAGRHEEALETLTQALDSGGDDEPVDAEICAALAEVLAADGALDQAREIIERIRLQDPRQYAWSLARLHAEAGEIDRAVVVLGEEIDRDGVIPLSALELARIYRDHQMHAEQVEVLETALERLESPNAAQALPVGAFPTLAMRRAQIEQYRLEVLVSLGFARGLAGDRDGAIAAMNDALSIDEGNVAALNYVGYTLAEQGLDLERAERLVRKALVLSPLDPAILDSLGWILVRQGRVDEALDHLEQAAARMPGSAVIWQHMGEALLAVGEGDRALECLERSVAVVEDDDPEARDAAVRAAELLDQLRGPLP